LNPIADPFVPRRVILLFVTEAVSSPVDKVNEIDELTLTLTAYAAGVVFTVILEELLLVVVLLLVEVLLFAEVLVPVVVGEEAFMVSWTPPPQLTIVVVKNNKITNCADNFISFPI